MADDSIDEILTALAAVEAAIVPPPGHKKALVYDETPGVSGGYPAFINVPNRSVRTQESGGVRAWDHTIDVYLLFGSQEYKYANRDQRKWAPVVVDALDSALRLGASVAGGYAIVDSVDYSLGGLDFVGVKFTLTVHAFGTFNYQV